MRHLLILALLCCCPTAPAAVFHSSKLGWRAGEDVTAAFEDFIKARPAGGEDELVLEHAFRIRGTHQLPDDFILTATDGGGFEVADATEDNNQTFLFLGHRNVLRNLTITYLDTPRPSPTAGTSPTRGKNFFPKIGLCAKDKKDIRLEHCAFKGSISHHLKLSDCARPSVTGCHFVGGYWTVYLTGNVIDPAFRNCVFEKCQGDGIKTGRGGSSGVKGALVDGCVFQDCGRDGIDTTGGWQDGIVRNSTFRRLFSGLDIKSYFEKPEHLSKDCMNTGIHIENCTFTDMANCITFSTLDRGLARGGSYFLNPETAREYAPHDIDINDCTFERTGQAPVRMLLLKGGHSIRYKNARFLGDGVQVVRYTNVFETFGAKSLSKEVSEALNDEVSGTLAPPGPAGATGIRAVPFAYGPRAEKR